MPEHEPAWAVVAGLVPEPAVPAWVTDVAEWEDGGPSGAWRCLDTSVVIEGQVVGLGACQELDGRVGRFSWDMGNLEGKYVDEPVAALRALAAWATSAADAIEADR